MYPYTYHVSLRIFHPVADPHTFTDVLGMKPSSTWRVDERRTTLKGKALKGHQKESFWCSRLKVPDDSDFPGFVSMFVERLAQHRVLFREIRNNGGRSEFYVSLSPGGSCLGDILGHDLLKALGQLDMDLSLDVTYALSA